MKKFVLILTTIFSASTAFATASIYEGPLLVFTQNSGFVPPEMIRSFRCEVYPNEVVKTSSIGTASLVTSTTAQLGGEYQGLIKKAAAGKIVDTGRDGHPTDGPESGYYAYYPKSPGKVQTVPLERRDVVGDYILENEAPEAKILIDLVKAACK